MNEQELRAINPEDFENVDIEWVNGIGNNGKPHAFTGRILYDYDMGLSILEKDNTEHCLTGLHGPAYKDSSNYTTAEQYNLDLTEAFKQLRDRVMDCQIHQQDTNYKNGFGDASCSFT